MTNTYRSERQASNRRLVVAILVIIASLVAIIAITVVRAGAAETPARMGWSVCTVDETKASGLDICHYPGGES